MTHKQFFVDLDRTLIDTPIFTATLWHHLGKKYKVDVPNEIARREEYYTYDGDMYDYHFFDHLEDLNIGKIESLTFDLTLYMQSQYLIYNDTENGLKTLDEMGEWTILTFGNERYQRFKLACVPELAKYKTVFVQQHKKNFFSTICTGPALLIDDKDIGKELPNNVEFIRIDRTQPLPVMEHSGYKSIRKLRNVKEAIQQ